MPSRTFIITMYWDDKDDDLYPETAEFNYYFRPTQKNIWENKRRYHKPFHRIIAERMGLDLSDNKVVDHINSNPFDNRRENLQSITMTENTRKASMRHDNVSGYRGVSYYKRDNKWRAQISVDNKQFLLGKFNTKEEAAIAYDNAAKYHYGDFAQLNFPDDFRNEGTDDGKTRD